MMLILLSFNGGRLPPPEAYRNGYIAAAVLLIVIALIRNVRFGALLGGVGAVLINYYIEEKGSGDLAFLGFVLLIPIYAVVGAIAGVLVAAICRRIWPLRRREVAEYQERRGRYE